MAHYRGYTEVEALDGLIEAAEQAERHGEMRVAVVAKLHPKESIESLQLGPLARKRDLLVVADQPPWPCILAADAIVGMTSMFLLESAVAGRPTISFQPGAAHPESFVGTRVGMVPAASSVEELATLLAASLSGSPLPRGTQGTSGGDGAGLFAFQGAAGRVADTVLSLAGAHEVQPGVIADVAAGTVRRPVLSVISASLRPKPSPHKMFSRGILTFSNLKRPF